MTPVRPEPGNRSGGLSDRGRRIASSLAASAALFAAGVLALPAGAQEGAAEGEEPVQEPATVIGTVMVGETGEAVSNAEIVFQEAYRIAESDDRGRFRVGGLTPGTYRVRVRHLGLTSRTLALTLEPGQTIGLTVELGADPVEVEELVVQVEGRLLPGRLAAFEARRRRGVGHFLDRAELAERKGDPLYRILRDVPGVRTARCLRQTREERRSGRRGALGHVSESEHEGSRAANESPSNAEPQGEVSVGGETAPLPSAADGPSRRNAIPGCQEIRIGREGRKCTPAYYVDGAALPANDPTAIQYLFDILAEELEGVELYRSGELPPEFAGTDRAECGAIALWTRRGGPES